VLGLRRLTPFGWLMLIRRLPGQIRLCQALLRDRRVPTVTKAAALGALALVFSPFDIVQFIPIVGGISDLVLATLILDLFVANSPREVVREHIATLRLENRFEL
jgi:uncharacterized membrane protein YkvA (DUF1232 family)